MRRTVMGLLVMALVAVGSPALGSEAEAGLHAYSVDHLQADWTYPAEHGHGARWYYIVADVATDSTTGELVGSDAYAGLGKCNSDASSCWGHLRPYEVVEYVSDPALREATLVMSRGSHTQRVHFIATTPSAYSTSESKLDACPGQSKLVRQEFGWNAYASGEVFGKQVWTRSDMDPSSESMQRSIQLCVD